MFICKKSYICEKNFSTCDKRALNEDQNGIQHIVGNITNDLYALPMKKCLKKIHNQADKLSIEKEWDMQNELPPGWEKHEGNILDIIYISYYVT